jgi:hypothetical protein
MRFAVRESDGDVTFLSTERVPSCAMYQPPTTARCLAALSGFDAVAQLPGVTRILHNCRIGNAIDWRLGTASRLLTVYGVAKDHDRLAELYQKIPTIGCRPLRDDRGV